jgi:hypothetical protein
VDAEDHAIVRIAGQPAKNPSLGRECSSVEMRIEYFDYAVTEHHKRRLVPLQFGSMNCTLAAGLLKSTLSRDRRQEHTSGREAAQATGISKSTVHRLFCATLFFDRLADPFSRSDTDRRLRQVPAQ